MQLHIQDAQELFLLDNRLHEVLVLVEEETDIVATQRLLQTKPFAESTTAVSIQTWWESSPQTLELMGFRDVGTTIFLSVVFSLLVLGF